MPARPSARPAPRGQHPVAQQQWDGIEVALGAVIEARPGVHDVEMRVTARTSQHRVAPCGRSVQRRTGEGSLAGRAVITVGVQLVADPAGQHHDAGDREAADFPGSQVGQVGHLMPRRATAVGGRPGMYGASSDSAGITVAGFPASASGATSSIDETSGAAARIASSTAKLQRDRR